MPREKTNNSGESSGNVVSVGEGATVRSVNLAQGNGVIQAGRDVSIGFLSSPNKTQTTQSIDEEFELSPDLFISYISPEKDLAIERNRGQTTI